MWKPAASNCSAESPEQRRLTEATGRAVLGEEAWLTLWAERFECWFLGLPGSSQQGLRTCMGALALHIGSRLEAAWRRLLTKDALSTRASLAAAGPIEPRCESLLRALGPQEQRQKGNGFLELP